jgi:predicted DNA-binding transcriptional regulator YafY
MGRADDIEKAERLNQARHLLEQFDHVPDAVREMVRDCGVSPRQAYRYLQQARRLKQPVGCGRSQSGLHGQTVPNVGGASSVSRQRDRSMAN